MILVTCNVYIALFNACLPAAFLIRYSVFLLAFSFDCALGDLAWLAYLQYFRDPRPHETCMACLRARSPSQCTENVNFIIVTTSGRN